MSGLVSKRMDSTSELSSPKIFRFRKITDTGQNLQWMETMYALHPRHENNSETIDRIAQASRHYRKSEFPFYIMVVGCFVGFALLFIFGTHTDTWWFSPCICMGTIFVFVLAGGIFSHLASIRYEREMKSLNNENALIKMRGDFEDLFHKTNYKLSGNPLDRFGPLIYHNTEGFVASNKVVEAVRDFLERQHSYDTAKSKTNNLVVFDKERDSSSKLVRQEKEILATKKEELKRAYDELSSILEDEYNEHILWNRKEEI